MTQLTRRIVKLESVLLPPEPYPEWVQIVLDNISEKTGINQWMCENDTKTPPENTIFLIIVHP
jgi:hypothetical protein